MPSRSSCGRAIRWTVGMVSCTGWRPYVRRRTVYDRGSDSTSEERDRMRMRAAVLEQFGQPLAVQEVELEEPRAGEVLVRLEACGVCHTDMYTASGADPSRYG